MIYKCRACHQLFETQRLLREHCEDVHSGIRTDDLIDTEREVSYGGTTDE